MRKALIDTNIYSAFKRNNTNIIQIFQHLDFIGVNVTVLGELYAGFKGSQREENNRRGLENFMNMPRVHFINTDRDTADFYAQIFDGLKRKGTPIPANDIWIAACAMQNGLGILSFDKHFSHIDGLLRITPPRESSP